MPRFNPTKEEIRAAENLKQIYHRHKQLTGENQEHVAEKMGFTQSFFSQLVCCHTPISKIETLVRLTTYFKVNPSDIREDLK